jgi:hypothetical protein
MPIRREEGPRAEVLSRDVAHWKMTAILGAV